MEKEVQNVIVAWAKAHDEAKDNAALLLRNWSKYEALCVARMEEVSRCDEALLRLADRDDLPPALTRFINANDDKGCASCWYSSCLMEHKECEKKSHEYFSALDNLVRFGLEL